MIVEVNEEQFRQYVEHHSHVAVFFHTPFCANCSYARMMLESVMKRLPMEATIISGDLNRMPSLAEPLQIMTVPLLLLLKKGEPVEQFVAFGRADGLYYLLIKFFGETVKSD